MFRKMTGGRFLSVGLLSLCLFASSLHAQEKGYAPLVESQTKGIARFDLDQFDMQSFTRQISNVVTSLVDVAVTNKAEKDQMKMIVPMMVTMMLAQYSPIIDTMKRAGVKEFYVVMTPDDAPVSTYYIAFPSEGMSAENVQALRDLCSSMRDMNFNFRFPFNRHNFVIAPMADYSAGDNEIKNYIKERFSKLTPVSKPVIDEEMKRRRGEAVTFVGLVDEKEVDQTLETVQTMALTVISDGEQVEKFKKSFDETMRPIFKNVDAMVYGFNTNNLKMEVEIRMKSTGDVAKAKEAFTKFSTQASKDAKDADAAKTLQETFVPKTDGLYLRWVIDQSLIDANKGMLFGLLGAQGFGLDALPFGK